MARKKAEEKEKDDKGLTEKEKKLETVETLEVE